MMTVSGRVVQNNQVVRGQIDLFAVDGFTRVVGLVPSQITSTLFFNNVMQPWNLISGVGVTDPQVTVGNVYWQEIAGAPGYYGIRFFPNAVGYWRLVITYPTGSQIVAIDFDVIDPVGSFSQGLSSTFNRPGC